MSVQACHATQANYEHCKYSTNRGWCDTSRYAELFGTPERAARTLVVTAYACDSSIYCSESDCIFKDAPSCPPNCGPDDYDALLEWLRGEHE